MRLRAAVARSCNLNTNVQQANKTTANSFCNYTSVVLDIDRLELQRAALTMPIIMANSRVKCHGVSFSVSSCAAGLAARCVPAETQLHAETSAEIKVENVLKHLSICILTLKHTLLQWRDQRHITDRCCADRGQLPRAAALQPPLSHCVLRTSTAGHCKSRSAARMSAPTETTKPMR